ncbi:MAG TPA: hypothetical protein VIQ11_12990 [Mycobacterium sp.]
MPQDRKPKAAAAKTGDGYFSFTHKGKKYTFPKPFDVVRAPGFMRQNRRRDPLDLTFTMIEALADDDEDLLAVIDGMEPAEFQSLSTRMGQALQSSVGAVADAVGESEGS